MNEVLGMFLHLRSLQLMKRNGLAMVPHFTIKKKTTAAKKGLIYICANAINVNCLLAIYAEKQ